MIKMDSKVNGTVQYRKDDRVCISSGRIQIIVRDFNNILEVEVDGVKISADLDEFVNLINAIKELTNVKKR